jgi:putative transcriptional regulator
MAAKTPGVRPKYFVNDRRGAGDSLFYLYFKIYQSNFDHGRSKTTYTTGSGCYRFLIDGDVDDDLVFTNPLQYFETCLVWLFATALLLLAILFCWIDHFNTKIQRMKNTLKVERAKKNWTQADLAKHIGVSRQSLNAIETGKFIPSTVLALRMAKVFDTTVEILFQLDDLDL